jgi:hypothetical protein
MHYYTTTLDQQATWIFLSLPTKLTKNFQKTTPLSQTVIFPAKMTVFLRPQGIKKAPSPGTVHIPFLLCDHRPEKK